ncbi:mobile mystery protein A [Variovorax sp. OV329]|uniref:mobile mystery protein A n=1 Tax=Variovorax sp. OV329 TaxID=1882825 RepID=UPI0008F1CA40|nr:mobile mystery protein A [Variovorax sp. OV329]SFM82871.1 mobile mystery protein A [Variovorax sp. OV329]
MKPEFQLLKLEQLQSATQAFAALLNNRPPKRGWLKEIREALGRTERQQAQLLGITGPTLHKSEAAEAEGRITLAQLRKLGDGLDCELVYALVPRKPLGDMVNERALELAKKEVMGVAHTMSLEDQRPSDARLQKQLERRKDELLRGKWSKLWRP